MQRLLCILALLVTTATLSFAQQSTTTVVYLKNGSIIKGKMLSSKSSDKVKVETPDGSEIFFTNGAIQQVTREPATPEQGEIRNVLYLQNGSVVNGKITKIKNSDRMKITTPNGSVLYFTEQSVVEIARPDDGASYEVAERTPQRQQQQQQQQPATKDPRAVAPLDQNVAAAEVAPKTTGYRGFLDFGYTMKMGDISTKRIEITTSQGYQINSKIFIGLGAGINMYSDGLYYKGVKPWLNEENATLDSMNISMSIPIFLDFRINFLDKGTIIPFAGLKVGYTLGFVDGTFESPNRDYTETKAEGLGLYLSPSVGAKVKIGTTFAINMSLGYAVQTFKHYPEGVGTEATVTKNNGGISLRLGLEF